MRVNVSHLRHMICAFEDRRRLCKVPFLVNSGRPPDAGSGQGGRRSSGGRDRIIDSGGDSSLGWARELGRPSIIIDRIGPSGTEKRLQILCQSRLTAGSAFVYIACAGRPEAGRTAEAGLDCST